MNDKSTIMSKYKTSPHWVAGDWNLPDIDWSSNHITGNQYPKIINEYFLNFLNDSNL